ERRCVTARIERVYQVFPVTLSQKIAYDSPNHQQPRQNKTKRSSFEQILQEQLKGQQLEENQTFQLYC
uniref:hypothetical protein n=1 Tax=Agathobacter sp. TaxID=2021311 RepID=UPI003FED5A82